MREVETRSVPCALPLKKAISFNFTADVNNLYRVDLCDSCPVGFSHVDICQITNSKIKKLPNIDRIYTYVNRRYSHSHEKQFCKVK